MARETQRQRAERLNSAQKYFTYGDRQYRDYYWVPQYLKTMTMDEVLCDDCDYVPRADSQQPRKAFRAHVKKHHPVTWYTEYAKPYVIEEEPDWDPDTELAALRASLYA